MMENRQSDLTSHTVTPERLAAVRMEMDKTGPVIARQLAEETHRALQNEKALGLLVLQIDAQRLIASKKSGQDIQKRLCLRLAGMLRHTDIVGVYEHDKIVAILPKTDLEHGSLMMKRIGANPEAFTLRLVGVELTWRLAVLSDEDACAAAFLDRAIESVESLVAA